MDIRIDYTSASCNCTYNALELKSDHNLIFYGCKSSVAIYDLEEERIREIGVGHKSKITCLRFVKKLDLDLDDVDQESLGKDCLLTVDAEGTLIIWEIDYLSGPGDRIIQQRINKLIDKDLTLNVCDGLYIENNDAFVACGGGQPKILIFKTTFSSDYLETFQEINLPSKSSLPMEIAFHKFNNEIILAIGLDTGAVLLYKSNGQSDFSFFGELNKHEDWVRCITFGNLENGDTLMASGGEDSYIAIWRISKHPARVNEFEFQLHELDKDSKIFFDSMIIGHEGWINSLHFNSKGELLSCSSDQSTIVWENPDGEVWIEKNRFGVMGGQIPGGFGAKFSQTGDLVVSWGFQGSIHIWQNNRILTEENEEIDNWEIRTSVCGHFQSVTDLDYNQNGQWIVTCSLDQTTRIHSKIIKEDGNSIYHEIGRPQIHGYDLFTCKTQGDLIISGAEEKILRAFQPTNVFQKSLSKALNIDFDINVSSQCGLVPALGLSNQNTENDSVAEEYTGNILDEDFLRSKTLWPEIAKLYGHAYEISCLATSPKDPLIVSASVSSQTKYSAIILWSSKEWKHLGEFPFHKLNVIDLEFNASGTKLLSSSRDRTWALWNVINDNEVGYTLEFSQLGSFHTRALWVGTWSPLNSLSEIFVTGGRDKKLAVWDKNHDNNKYSLAISKDFESSVSSASINQSLIIAVGLENGKIFLFQFSNSDALKLNQIFKLDNSLAHTELVKRLRFNPKDENQFASAGSDNLVRVYHIVTKC